MVEVKLNLPLAFEVDDYHEFGYYHDFVQQLSPRLKVEEVEFGGRGYWGIIYAGRKPSQTKIGAALCDAGFIEDEDE